MTSRSGGKVELILSYVDLLGNFHRSGCPMGINSPKSPLTFMSLGIPPPLPSQPSPTMTNHGTVSSSIPKLPTLHADEKSSENSFSVSAAVRHTGQWSVTNNPKRGGVLLTATYVVSRRNSSGRKSLAFARSADQRDESSGRSVVVLIALLPPNSCTRPSETGKNLHRMALWYPVHAERRTRSFHAVMVDNGVLRLDEAAQVDQMLRQNLGVNLTVVDASDLFLKRLEDVDDPEQKRKIIGNTFIHVFEDEAAKLEAEAEKAEAEGEDRKGKIEWLLQGTLYPDVIESISFKGPSATIKTHHNVGGLLKDMKLKLIEPLRELFKGSFAGDIVRSV